MDAKPKLMYQNIRVSPLGLSICVYIYQHLRQVTIYAMEKRLPSVHLSVCFCASVVASLYKNDKQTGTDMQVRTQQGWTGICNATLTHLSLASFVGHWQTVQNQVRRRKTRRLIRFSTVCLQKFLYKMKMEKKTPKTLKTEMYWFN